MIAKAQGRFIPVSPRKIRSIARLIRGLDVSRAQAILENLNKQRSHPVAKVLKSAVANATRDGSVSVEQLRISRIMADEGPRGKRVRAAARGQAKTYKKRMSHLIIELDARS